MLTKTYEYAKDDWLVGLELSMRRLEVEKEKLGE